MAVSKGRRERRHAIGFLDRLFGLLEHADAEVAGRVWIKGIGKPVDQWAIYTSSIQAICTDFQHYLQGANDHGVVTADSRSPAQNVRVSHSIFTRKYAVAGDPYDRTSRRRRLATARITPASKLPICSLRRSCSPWPPTRTASAS